MKVFNDATLRGAAGSWEVERLTKKGPKKKNVPDTAIDARLPDDRLDGCPVTMLTSETGDARSVRVVPRGMLDFVPRQAPAAHEADLDAATPALAAVYEPDPEKPPAPAPGAVGSLLFIDVIGVQDYVFRSNRLRDVIGASRLVTLATKATSDDDGGDEIGVLARALAAGDETADVLSDAGGNAVVRVRGGSHEQDAKSIATRYSRLLLDHVPGLDVLVHRHSYQENRLARGLKEGFDALARAKDAQRSHSPLLGLGVTQVCSMTGLPAVTRDRDGLAISARVEMTRRFGGGREGDGLSAAQRQGFMLSTEFDQLGRSHSQRSLLGIVHVDGNAVGKRIRAWLARARERAVPDDELVAQYREWSGGLERLGEAVRAELLRAVIEAIDWIDGVPHLVGTHQELNFPLRETDGRVILPVRPVLLGGDDLTFVCDGRIALDLAARALRAFEHAPDVPHLGKVYAAAGVSIVHSHAPFARAYELSARLTESAKRLTRGSDGVHSALDWHLGATRPRAEVADIRARQYRVTARPVPLDGHRIPSWRWLVDDVLDHEVHGFRGEAWSERRSKVKQLAGLAAGDAAAVARQLQAWKAVDARGLDNPVLVAAHADTHGIALIDAAELLDIHQPLRQAEPAT